MIVISSLDSSHIDRFSVLLDLLMKNNITTVWYETTIYRQLVEIKFDSQDVSFLIPAAFVDIDFLSKTQDSPLSQDRYFQQRFKIT